MNIKGKRLFVFDIDGTLVDSTKPHQAAFLGAVKEIVGEPKNTDWGSYKDHTDSGIFRDIIQESDQESFDLEKMNQFDSTLERLFLEIIDHEPLVEISGARNFLDLVIKNGDCYCYATGSMRSAAIHKLKVVQLNPRLELLTTASGFQTREEIVTSAIEKAKVEFGEDTFTQIISIGDGIWDFKTAQNLNLDFLGIGNKLEGLLPKETMLHKDFSTIPELLWR